MDYIPQVTWGDVVRVVRREFPSEDPKAILSILDEYGKGPWDKERDRVHPAILKLSGGDLKQMRRYLKIAASSDPRDVIYPAEPPRFWEIGFVGVAHLSPEAKERLMEDDWQEYQLWLHAK